MAKLVDPEGSRAPLCRWMHTSLWFQDRQESAPALSPFLSTPHCLFSWEETQSASLAGNTAHSVLLRSHPTVLVSTLHLAAVVWTLKYKIEKTCLSLLSAALPGCSCGEDGLVGGELCLWGSPQPLETKLRSFSSHSAWYLLTFFFSKDH